MLRWLLRAKGKVNCGARWLLGQDTEGERQCQRTKNACKQAVRQIPLLSVTRLTPGRLSFGYGSRAR